MAIITDAAGLENYCQDKRFEATHDRVSYRLPLGSGYTCHLHFDRVHEWAQIIVDANKRHPQVFVEVLPICDVTPCLYRANAAKKEYTEVLADRTTHLPTQNQTQDLLDSPVAADWDHLDTRGTCELYSFSSVKNPRDEWFVKITRRIRLSKSPCGTKRMAVAITFATLLGKIRLAHSMRHSHGTGRSLITRSAAESLAVLTISGCRF